MLPMIASKEARLIICIVTLVGSFVLILLHGLKMIDLGDFGIAGIATWVTMILQFYVRKKPANENVNKETQG